MNITTDFQKWLNAAEPEGHQEVYSLYRAVEDCSSFGIYDVKPAKGSGGRWIVSTSHLDEGLLLASDEAREAFLLHVTRTYCDRDLDMESWYSYKHSIAKDD